MTSLLVDGPDDAVIHLLLAHGAGAPMDSASMNAASKALGAEGLHVRRLECGYMAARRSGHRKPPPRAESLMGKYLEAVEAATADRPVIIGGKSMGGPVAYMDELFARRRSPASCASATRSILPQNPRSCARSISSSFQRRR